ncbi:MAG: hypothetical protein HFJ57_00535 [Clostridia bacterium]|nr:hypothetical protein [Clostridia bacterium]
MDELDRKLFNDLSEQVEIPIRCEYIIKNALKSRKNKNTIRNITLIVAKACGIIFLTSGIVFASAKIYENVWKEPQKIDSFYGDNYEYDGNELYGIGHTKDIEINEKNVITKDKAKIKFEAILKKFGYENEKIISIELADNPSDDSLLYRATTENKFMLDLDAKDTRNFKIFTNVAYKDIENYRGTQEEVQRVVEEICKKQGYDLSTYNHKEIKFNISQKVYEEALLNNVYIEDSPENATIWEIKYNKEHNGIINKYEEITVGIVPEINELYYFIYTDKSPQNTDIVVDKEKAKEIALAKEKELNVEHNVKNIDIELDIIKMNGYAYLRKNDYEHYYKSRTTPNYPIEKLQYYRVEDNIRQVWRVKLEFEQANNSKYNRENSFTYFIDTTTGEVVGGE